MRFSNLVGSVHSRSHASPLYVPLELREHRQHTGQPTPAGGRQVEGLRLGDQPEQIPRKTATRAWSKAETERRRYAVAIQRTLAPIDAFPDEYATADDLAAAGLHADPGATGPRSQTIRGLLGGACAGWRVRPTSVELYDALRADNPTRRQRSIATVLINEASFEDLVNAHTEGAFAWRQLARAARRQGAVPPLRIRQINAFATPPSRPENRWRS